MEFKIGIKAEQLKYIGSLLERQPYIEVVGIINSINKQIKEQQTQRELPF